MLIAINQYLAILFFEIFGYSTIFDMLFLYSNLTKVAFIKFMLKTISYQRMFLGLDLLIDFGLNNILVHFKILVYIKFAKAPSIYKKAL